MLQQNNTPCAKKKGRKGIPGQKKGEISKQRNEKKDIKLGGQVGWDT